jgi:ABC-type multidrug transport system fused ATPase/permease subunit
MITLGAITSFYFYMLMLLWNFMMISYTFGNLFSILGASEKIIKIMELKPRINTKGGLKLDNCNGTIEVRDAKFRYPTKKDVQVLKGISFTVENNKNRVIALCGTSGCGKSSIIGLLERFYDVEEGEVLFNGINIKELDPRWYHE